MKNIATNFCHKTFTSPLVMVSGVLTSTNDFINAQKQGAGGITTKSYTYYPRQGNPMPVVTKYQAGFLNSVGLRNAGIAEAKIQISELKKVMKIPVLLSIFDTKIRDFAQLSLHLVPFKPDFIELNLSCPNVENDMGKPLATNAESAYEVVKTVKKLMNDETKIIAKLTPNVTNIKEVALAVEKGGADAISAINTVSQGMTIDLRTKKPTLGAKMGALSGPAILPIAIRCVYEIYETVKIPIIGMGGITTTEDALQMFMAGASLIGIGSAIYLSGMKVFNEINNGIAKYLKENNYSSINDIMGLAH